MPEWKIRREDAEFAAPDVATLQKWAAQGRVRPIDYVHNPMLNQWMYAKDVQELRATFAARNAAGSGGGEDYLLKGSAASKSCGLAIVLFLGAGIILLLASNSLIFQAFASLVGTAAFIFGIIGVVLYFLKK
ncbi:MAG TPA: hypothetical protein VF701_08600 [Thermoanaerobaculia bacterium]